MNAPLKPTDLIKMDFAARKGLNGELRSARNTTMTTLIGNPRSTYNDDCQDPQDAVISSLLVTETVGPIRVRGLLPAVEALRKIMQDIETEHPDIHKRIGTAGMLCCRNVRGSTTVISNHSWGTAVDLKIDGVLDVRGNDAVQAGLLTIAPIFNRHGFYWGAAFRTEDAMHFEASEQLIESWARDGRFGPQAPYRKPGLTIGDRGPEVVELQLALNRHLAPGAGLTVDGLFGKDTRAALIAFQRVSGLQPDGVATVKTGKALGLKD